MFVSTEQLVTTEALDLPANSRFNPFERSVVTGVIEAPLGAHPTGASPDYGIDMAHLKTYVGATSPEEHANAITYDYPMFSKPMTTEEFTSALTSEDALADSSRGY